LRQNLDALAIVDRLDDGVMQRIDTALAG
jgi:hypothetical protein